MLDLDFRILNKAKIKSELAKDDPLLVPCLEADREFNVPSLSSVSVLAHPCTSMSTDHRVLPSSQSRWHFQVENGNRAGANDFASEPSSPLPKTRSPAFLLLFLFYYVLARR
jgi:hypothetical protein